jgi:phage terminase large subunit-like protein
MGKPPVQMVGWRAPRVTSGATLRGPVMVPDQRPSTDVDPVSAYAWDILDGGIVACRYTILAAERHFYDLAQGPGRGLTFSLPWVHYALSFFGDYLRHSKGEWAGQPLVLSPWQQFAIGSVYGWFRAGGTRRFRTAYEEVARKNGKSTTAAGVGLFGLAADNEPGAEIYTAATMRDQARIIFNEAQQMVRRSPDLQATLSVFKFNISQDSSGSKFEPLSADDRTLDGLNPHLILIDELHKHRNRAVLDVLDTAMGARRNPLLWMITTAGDDNPESVYAAENAYAIQVLEGTVVDDSYFGLIYTLDQNDRWDDEAVWIKANPNLNVSVKLDDLQRQAEKAARSPPNLPAFKRLRLNLRTSDANRAIDMAAWAKNSLGPFDPAELHGRRFFAGLDISAKIDLTAWVKLFPPVGEETRWRVVARFWMPADTVEEKSDRDRVQYRRWIDAGLIEATEGNVVDQREILNAVIEDARLHDCASCAYDPWNATTLAVSLAEQGVPMHEFIQGMKSYTAPTKELGVMLLSEKLDHGGNEVLTWMAASMMSLTDRNENLMPSKKHSVGRIDGMSALIMAIGRSMAEDPNAGLDGFLSDPIAL